MLDIALSVRPPASEIPDVDDALDDAVVTKSEFQKHRNDFLFKICLMRNSWYRNVGTWSCLIRDTSSPSFKTDELTRKCLKLRTIF